MSDAAQKRARDPPAVDLTDDPSPEKRQKKALTAIAKEFICPITQELPIQPVTAEDGKIYEETAIRKWFAAKLETNESPTSPATGAEIGPKLLPAPQARNTIEALVESGAIEGEIAEAWTKKLRLETRVKEIRAIAERGRRGDGEAMWKLGVWYQEGVNGLARDLAKARAWYERSAATRDPRGMAAFGQCLLADSGRESYSLRGSYSLGLVNVTEAAHLGSDLGALLLGESFFNGMCGLPEDPVRARYWLKKAVDGECEIKHVDDEGLAEAAAWLRELDQEDQEE